MFSLAWSDSAPAGCGCPCPCLCHKGARGAMTMRARARSPGIAMIVAWARPGVWSASGGAGSDGGSMPMRCQFARTMMMAQAITRSIWNYELGLRRFLYILPFSLFIVLLRLICRCTTKKRLYDTISFLFLLCSNVLVSVCFCETRKIWVGLKGCAKKQGEKNGVIGMVSFFSSNFRGISFPCICWLG